jgi:hypothetical protein
MAKITAYIPEPTQDYDVNNQRQILEAFNTIKNQLNFGFQKDLKDELETFNWFLIGTDGGSAFYLNHLNIDKQDFITSFIGEVRKIPPTEWSAKIKKILEDNRAINVTNDDKTLIFFAKKNFINKDLKMMFKNSNTQGIAQENKKKEEEQVFENDKQNKNKAGFQESKFKSHKLLLIIVFASSLLLGLVSYFLIN